ncbi:MAG: hypothetical protein R2822_27225 [Spirosomataceae bacterium]
MQESTIISMGYKYDYSAPPRCSKNSGLYLIRCFTFKDIGAWHLCEVVEVYQINPYIAINTCYEITVFSIRRNKS